MKTGEELNALKEEVENLNKKLHELSEEELRQVTGGYGNIPISGGMVSATTGGYASGIGGGQWGSGGGITITRGTVTATSEGAADIGAGRNIY